MQCSRQTELSREHCVLSQAIAAEENDEVGIGIIVIRRIGAENGIFQVIAPLSVLLPNGVSLQIDQSEERRLPFYRCLKAGCRAETILDEDLLDRLNSSKIATIVIYLAPNQPLKHLVPLWGFKEAYEKLK